MPSNNSFSDLEPGSALKIILPLLKSGGFLPELQTEQINANTFNVRADDFIGYTTLHYTAVGRKGTVTLKFVSAEQTQQGNTTSLPQSPPLPFALPHHRAHVRLVYLVRVSRADHNMAIVASKRIDALNAFTARLNEHPEICKTADGIFCSWVPAGVAVRVEHQSH